MRISLKSAALILIALFPALASAALQNGKVEVGLVKGTSTLIDPQTIKKPLASGLVFQEERLSLRSPLRLQLRPHLRLLCRLQPVAVVEAQSISLCKKLPIRCSRMLKKPSRPIRPAPEVNFPNAILCPRFLNHF